MIFLLRDSSQARNMSKFTRETRMAPQHALRATKSAEIFCLLSIATASVLAAVSIFSSFTKMPVNVDAGYYVSIAKEVMEGATPTVQVKTSYPPAVYYAYAAWMKMFGSNYSNIVLLVYAVHAVNCLLFYLIISHFLGNFIVKGMLCLSYFCAVMLSEGYYVELEPFQVLFVLLAYLIYLKNLTLFLKHSLIGFCFGLSMMCKQYSLIVFLGFLVALWFDFRKKESLIAIVQRVSITLFFSLIPFLIFVTFTQAHLADSVYSFAFLRRSPVSYLSQGGFDVVSRIGNILTSFLQRNWFFIPFLFYLCYEAFDKKGRRSDISLIPLFLASLAPLLVRQYGHYFQLIAPWSYIMMAILSERALRPFQSPTNNLYLLASSLLCLFLIMPITLFATRHLYYFSWPFAGITALFLTAVVVVLLLGMYFSRYTINSTSLLFLMLAVIFLETLLIGLKIPLYGPFDEQKRAQMAEAEEINKIFARGTYVYVIDSPELYVTGDLRNPLHDYDLVFPGAENAFPGFTAVEWSKIDKVIVRRNSAIISPQMLNQLGYRAVESSPSLGVVLYQKV